MVKNLWNDAIIVCRTYILDFEDFFDTTEIVWHEFEKEFSESLIPLPGLRSDSECRRSSIAASTSLSAKGANQL